MYLLSKTTRPIYRSEDVQTQLRFHRSEHAYIQTIFGSL